MRLIDADAMTDELIKGIEADTDKSIQTSFTKSVCMILCKAIDQQPTIDAEPHWIPVSERLPEDDVEVLVTDDSGGVQWLAIDRMLSYEDGSGRVWINSQNPIAWMLLPKPYKGDKE